MPLNKTTLSIAIKLKLAMEKKSVDEVLDTVKVKRSALYRALNGHSVHADTLICLIEWLDLPLDDFLDKESKE